MHVAAIIVNMRSYAQKIFFTGPDATKPDRGGIRSGFVVFRVGRKNEGQNLPATTGLD
jgi:hypothetical protein